MRFGFVESVLRELLDKGILGQSNSVLAVCAGDEEKRLFLTLGFTNVTISNLDERVAGNEFTPFKWSFQDAQNLSFGDAQFDFAFVSDGLHHCKSPHRALLEMYRVASGGILMFEGRDSWLMRLANWLKLTPEYELEAVVGNDFRYGGVNNSHVPNYIYRWTERELEKTIKACDPTCEPRLQFFYGLSLPYELSAMRRSSLKLNAIKAAAPFVRVLTSIFKRQNNLFAMVVLKPGVPEGLWPWLELRDGKLIFDRSFAEKIFKNKPRDV